MQLDMEQGFHTLCHNKVTIAEKSRGDAWLISSGISSLFSLCSDMALRIIINRKERLYLFASPFDITSALRSVPPVRWLSGRVMLLCPRATEFHLVASEQPT